MAVIQTKDLRNICFLGHGGSGKTSLAEAMLYMNKATDRLGSTGAGNTVCDYDPEEIKRGFTISASCANFNYKNVKINGQNVKLYSGWSKAKSVTTKK